MNISKFDYHLPRDLIANSPAKPRDRSRLMVIDRKTMSAGKQNGYFEHKYFYDIIDYLTPNDILILNKTKVFPARFFGVKETGGKIEVLLVEEMKKGIWKALTKPGLKIGQSISFRGQSYRAIGHNKQTVLLKTLMEKYEVLKLLQKYGHTPIPPYINSKDPESKLRKEYQTVYAKTVGSVAAPTAGLHFTNRLLAKLKKKGVQIEYVTLHVGIGTFAPVKTKKLEDHKMHYEYFEIDKDVAKRILSAKKAGKRIVAVGTTTSRILETLSNNTGALKTVSLMDLSKTSGFTNLFIHPGYKFKFVDALITNFHLPKSTLLCLVSALVSFPNTNEVFTDFEKSLIGKAYTKAIKNKYRFYSFGDACFIE